MERLIRNTTAYKIFRADRLAGKLPHAFLLHFQDEENLRAALNVFAVEFFGAEKDISLKNRILNGSYTDLTVYPAEGKKISADGIAEIIEDSSMCPVEGERKLYVIVGFEQASSLVQNKLLKTLEEPLAGIHFLLGATTLSPVLDTVKSRVRLLEIPPFTEEEIFSALEREGSNPLNASAAAGANGILGDAQRMVRGGWYREVQTAAREICETLTVADISVSAKKYGDTKYKRELLSEMRNYYFSALSGRKNTCLSAHTLIFALENLSRAEADLKFNAFFQGLLYDFMLKVVKENDRWQKLQA